MSDSDIRLWNRTPAQNSSAPPTGAPEGGVAFNQLNDIAREMMAQVRRWWEDSAWVSMGDDATYVSATQFSVPGDQSAQYHQNRRVRAVGTLTTTIYGTISGVAVAANTTVTVTWDSGTLQSEALAVSLGTPVTGSAVAASSVADLVVFPAGTRMVFQQSTPPVGWAKETDPSYEDVSLRLTTGGAGSRLGNDKFSTVFPASATTAGYTLTEADIPAHSHQLDPTGGGGSVVLLRTAGTGAGYTTGSAGQENTTATQQTGGGGAHSHGMTMNLDYYDVIIAQKQ